MVVSANGPARHLRFRNESWPIAGQFRISRGSKTTAEVLVVELHQAGMVGRGESVPYPRFGETMGSCLREVEASRSLIEGRSSRVELATALPAGAARNAIDCALWDLEAKLTGRRVWELAGLPRPRPVRTARTISLDEPEIMGRIAKERRSSAVLKLKVGGEEDLERVSQVRQNAPEPYLIVDANEGWSTETYASLAPRLAELGVDLIEQPLAEGHDEALERLERPVALCADESCHDQKTISALAGRYDFVNIKLDKTGGLTEALAVKQEARRAGLSVIVGCMVCTSLALAPATLLAQNAELADLDGALLLSKDRVPGLVHDGDVVHPPEPDFWG